MPRAPRLEPRAGRRNATAPLTHGECNLVTALRRILPPFTSYNPKAASWPRAFGAWSNGVSLSAVRNWISGRSTPNLEDFIAVVRACGYEMKVEFVPMTDAIAERPALFGDPMQGLGNLAGPAFVARTLVPALDRVTKHRVERSIVPAFGNDPSLFKDTPAWHDAMTTAREWDDLLSQADVMHGIAFQSLHDKALQEAKRLERERAETPEPVAVSNDWVADVRAELARKKAEAAEAAHVPQAAPAPREVEAEDEDDSVAALFAKLNAELDAADAERAKAKANTAVQASKPPVSKSVPTMEYASNGMPRNYSVWSHWQVEDFAFGRVNRNCDDPSDPDWISSRDEWHANQERFIEDIAAALLSLRERPDLMPDHLQDGKRDPTSVYLYREIG